MRFHGGWVASLLVLLLGAPAAHAQSGGAVYGAPGAYLQFGGGAAIEDFDLPSSIDVDEGFVIDPVLGYRLNRVIAVELQGRYLDEMDIEFLGSELGVDGWSVLFNAKFYAPFDWRLQPFVKIGSGYTEIEIGGDDTDDSGIHWGAGAEYYLDESVAIGVDGGRFHGLGDLDDFDYWTAGGFVKFRY